MARSRADEVAEEAAAKIKRARASLVMEEIFFGAIALGLTPKADPSAKTGWTDGVSLGYNPAWVNELTLEQVKGFWAHEVAHIGAGHHARRQARQEGRWNLACDHAINDMLAASKFVLPPEAVRGMGDESAEAIYAKLPPDPPGGGSSGKDQSGAGQDQDGQDGQGAGQDQDEDPGGCGAVRDAPGKGGKASPSELAQAEADAKVKVAQAVTLAKAAGQLPAAVARWVEEVLETYVPWREVLRRFLDEAAKNDYTWTRPNRRYLGTGFLLPSLYNHEMRPIAVAVDTSGSIGGPILDQFGAELTAIIEDTRASATIVYCDAAVQGVVEVGPDDLPVRLEPKGGGGTDFRPVFEEVERRGLEPSCLVYLTDGECWSFPEEPAYPVLWAVIGRRDFRPPFGEVVQVRPD